MCLCVSVRDDFWISVYHVLRKYTQALFTDPVSYTMCQLSWWLIFFSVCVLHTHTHIHVCMWYKGFIKRFASLSTGSRRLVPCAADWKAGILKVSCAPHKQIWTTGPDVFSSMRSSSRPDKHKSETVLLRTFKPMSTIWFWPYWRGGNVGILLWTVSQWFRTYSRSQTKRLCCCKVRKKTFFHGISGIPSNLYSHDCRGQEHLSRNTTCQVLSCTCKL